MITDADIPKPEQPTIALETETVRGGGNRDAPGHFLSWLTRATTVYGYVTDGHAYDVGTPESYAEAQRAFQAVQDRSPR